MYQSYFTERTHSGQRARRRHGVQRSLWGLVTSSSISKRAGAIRLRCGRCGRASFNQAVPGPTPRTRYGRTSRRMHSRPQGMGTSDAAGLPVAPLLLNADEVIGTGTPAAPNGTVQHPTRFTMNHGLNYWVWPATQSAGVGVPCSGSSGSIPTESLDFAACLRQCPARSAEPSERFIGSKRRCLPRPVPPPARRLPSSSRASAITASSWPIMATPEG